MYYILGDQFIHGSESTDEDELLTNTYVVQIGTHHNSS